LNKAALIFFLHLNISPSFKLIKTDFLIIGQGIAGTLLSHELMRLGKSVIVVDSPGNIKSSLVAGAVLNPMAGKNWTPSPQANIFLPKAIEVYQQIEALLNISILKETTLKVFHETKERYFSFEKQRIRFPEYLKDAINQEDRFFNAPFGYGMIHGLYQIDAAILLKHWKTYLESIDAFLEADFSWDNLHHLNKGIRYGNILATKIVFCTGAAAMVQPIFNALPFTKNRGEVLMVSIPDLPSNTIYHQHLRLIPKSNGMFWCGSNYSWNFENLDPDVVWRNHATTSLEHWLKIPFEIKDHLVALRPTTAGQIPLIGIHPNYKNLSIFNGLGTRGFSSGPYWAGELAKLLLDSNYKMESYNQGWFDKWF
jgi:glycine/D-amino acid oxidase-like deaminating enzyme